MANFEPEIEKTSESATSQSIESPICKGFMDHRGWVSLKEALLAHGKLTMKEVIHEVMVMLRHFMTSKATALFSYPRTDISTAKGCDYLHETKICCETLYKGITKNLCKEKENASRSTLTGPHEGCMASSANNSCEKAWQRKYAQVAGALELVSQFMGWEWTYNNLIIRFLWKMVPARLDQFHAAGLSHIFSLLFRIAEKGSKTDLPGLADLKRHIVDLLQSTPILIGKAESLSLH
ncbi:hypothetical protein KP509_32G001000 [Ceratopteris richardii]|uniref:Uncharacterized protein n=1 Tax=Ceratopteris richardii TaxID=49495 RepID=A0A8T2QRV4_CERRI|nr:hypothetical protein KP509_32G001000 [Ceratopteris richardii]